MSQAPSPPSRRQTAEQERAAFALGRVRDVQPRPFAGRYRQLVQGLAAMLLTSGLGQTLAFLKSKGGGKDGEHLAAYRHLSDWTSQRLALGPDLLEAITRMNVAQYRLAQAEALAVVGWLKRFAEAELPEGGER